MNKRHNKIVILEIAIFTLFINTVLFAEGPDTLWTKTFGGDGGDYGWSVHQTFDGGYIIAGGTSSFGAGNNDFYLIKTDENGDTVWTKTYGGVYEDFGYETQQTTDSGYIFVGSTESFGAGIADVYLIKTDSFGDTLWTKTYGYSDVDVGFSVQQTFCGGYIITGFTSIVFDWDVFLVKTDSNGDTLWVKDYGGLGTDLGNCVQQTADSGFIIVGSTNSFGAGNQNVYLIKTDSLGDTLWSRTYGGINDDRGNSVLQTSDGGYIIVGYTNSFGAGNGDVGILKTDSIGNILWTKTYGGIEDDEGYSVQQTIDYGYIITGNTNSFGAGLGDVWLLKIDENGDTLWTKTYGGTWGDAGNAVQQTSDEGYIIAGQTYSFGDSLKNVYLIKTESEFGITDNQIMNLQDDIIEIYPNPFNHKTYIRLQPAPSSGARPGIMDNGNTAMTIYDVTGCVVKSFFLPTAYSLLPIVVSWDGSDNYGRKMSNGIYFLKVDTANHTILKKLIIIK